MHIVKYPQRVEVSAGIARPYIYIITGLADNSDSKWIANILAAFGKQNVNGTIFLPEIRDGVIPNLVDPARWRNEVSWKADVVCCWFNDVPSQELKLIDLGSLIGRYCAGAGSGKVVVGASEKCSFANQIGCFVDSCNVGINGSWKIVFDRSMSDFIARLKSYANVQ